MVLDEWFTGGNHHAHGPKPGQIPSASRGEEMSVPFTLLIHCNDCQHNRFVSQWKTSETLRETKYTRTGKPMSFQTHKRPVKSSVL